MHWLDSSFPKMLRRHCELSGQNPDDVPSGDVFISELVHSPSMHLELLPIGCASGFDFWFSTQFSPFQHSSWAQQPPCCCTRIGAKLKCVLSEPSVGCHFSEYEQK